LIAGLGDLAFESAAFLLNERRRAAWSDLASTAGSSGGGTPRPHHHL